MPPRAIKRSGVGWAGKDQFRPSRCSVTSARMMVAKLTPACRSATQLAVKPGPQRRQQRARAASPLARARFQHEQHGWEADMLP